MSIADRQETEKHVEPQRERGTAGNAERPAPSNTSSGPVRESAKQTNGKPESRSGLQRAFGLIRSVAPVVQKVLPLLDGNVASVVSNMLVPRTETQRVDLEPIENALTKMRKEHLDLRMSLADHTATLKRVSEQVDTVKDVTERNALEAKELTTDLQRLRAKVNAFAWVGLGLLAVSILVNVLLFLRIQQLIH